MWLENPKVELRLDAVWENIEPPYNTDKRLVARVFSYLDRHGYINFGIFESVSVMMIPTILAYSQFYLGGTERFRFRCSYNATF